MGFKGRAFGPLCNLSIGTLVPANHFYRHLDAKLDLTFVRELVRTTYKAGDRPSIDPIVFFKLLSGDIGSDRRIADELAFRGQVRR